MEEMNMKGTYEIVAVAIRRIGIERVRAIVFGEGKAEVTAIANFVDNRMAAKEIIANLKNAV